MSLVNGDKSRSHRMRKQKLARRAKKAQPKAVAAKPKR